MGDSSLSIHITQTIEQIELLDRQLFHTELEMVNLATYLHSVIVTIPGIGSTNGGIILGEIVASIVSLHLTSCLHLLG